MTIHPSAPSSEVLAFLAERHLATLTTRRPDGTPHVTPVGFTYDAELRLVRIITWARSWKVRNIEAHPGDRAAVCQVDGARWLTLEGPAEVTDVTQRVAAAVDAYATRYRQPGERDDRVAIEISVDRIMGRAERG
jgi:PPOX class probable F420-dependent enzyme